MAISTDLANRLKWKHNALKNRDSKADKKTEARKVVRPSKKKRSTNKYSSIKTLIPSSGPIKWKATTCQASKRSTPETPPRITSADLRAKAFPMTPTTKQKNISSMMSLTFRSIRLNKLHKAQMLPSLSILLRQGPTRLTFLRTVAELKPINLTKKTITTVLRRKTCFPTKKKRRSSWCKSSRKQPRAARSTIPSDSLSDQSSNCKAAWKMSELSSMSQN